MRGAGPTQGSELDARGGQAPTVAVVGGGVGGLVAALTARRAGAEVELLEPHPPGGRARTDQRSGFTFNRGPRALYHRGAAERALRELGVDVASGGRPKVSGALAITATGVERLPVGPLAMATTRLLTSGEKVGAARHLLPLLRDPGPIDPNVTLAAWLDERGTTGGLRAVLEAMVRVATYIDAPEQLAAVDALRQARMGATTGVRYLDGGFGAIVDDLVVEAARCGVRTRATAARHVGEHGDRWRVATSTGPIDADAVVLAVGGPTAAEALLDEVPAAWSGLGPPARAACLELGVTRIPRRRFALGVDRPTYLSVHAPPASLAPPGQAVVHVMRYRNERDRLDPAASRAELLEVAHRAGIADHDIAEERYLDAMEVTGAIPLAARGGVAGRPPVAIDGRAGLFVVGDWVGVEGQLLDAVVASAALAGEQASARRATMAGR